MLKKILWLLWIALFIPLALFAQNPVSSYNVRRGIDAWQQGDYQAAYDALSYEVEHINPQNGVAYAILAFVCHDAKVPSKMVRSANHAVKYLPNSDQQLLPEVLMLLHSFYWESEDTIKAEEYLARALKVDTKNVKTYIYYDKFYRKLKRYDDMITLGKRAEKEMPKSSQGSQMQFEGFMAKKQYDEAMKAAGDIARKYSKSNDPEKYKLYAREYYMRALLAQKKYDKALQEALPLVDALHSNNVLTTIITIADSTDWQAVIDTLRIYEQEYDRQPWWGIMRGQIYRNQHRYAEAYVELYRCMQIQQMPDMWRHMGYIASNYLDDQKRAIDCLEHSIQLDSLNPGVHVLLGDVYYECKLYDKAIATLDKANRLAPGETDAYVLRARCMQETGRYDEAIEDFYSAMTANPQHGNFYFSIARVYGMKGDTAKMQEATEQGMKLYRLRRDSLGMNEYSSIGDYERACQVAREKLRPNSTDNYLYNTACVFALAGHMDEALKYLEQSMEKGFSNMTHIEHDEDLESLRNHPKYKELIAKYTAKNREMQQYVIEQTAK